MFHVIRALFTFCSCHLILFIPPAECVALYYFSDDGGCIATKMLESFLN